LSAGIEPSSFRRTIFPARSPRSCAHHLEAIAGAHVHKTVTIEDDARAEIVPAGRAGLRLEDRLHIDQATITQLGARDAGDRLLVVAGNKGKIEHMVLFERWMQTDIEQASLAAGEDGRDAGQGPGIEPAVGDYPQPARPFGDQHPPIGQEGHPPRLLEAAAHAHQQVRSLGAAKDILCADDRRRREQARRCRSKEATSNHKLS
jgi:hypothetical protein